MSTRGSPTIFSHSLTWFPSHRRLMPILFVGALVALLGCAGFTQRRGPVAFEPRGPGAVFGSIDAAAVDALSYALLDARRADRTRLMYGGTIQETRIGYTYSFPIIASTGSPVDIRYRLRRNDVARFHLYPRGLDLRVMRARENHTESDKQTVDEIDPYHRPLYILTPRLIVKAYRGGYGRTEVVAKLGETPDGTMLVMNDWPAP